MVLLTEPSCSTSGYGRPLETKTGAASSCMMLTCCRRTTTTPTPATNSSPHTCLWPWTSSDTGKSTVSSVRVDWLRYKNATCWDIHFKSVHWWCDSPRLPYPQYFGGVSAVTPDQYMKMNGFPNQYWGWGGEDDDIAARWGGMWGWTWQRSTPCNYMHVHLSLSASCTFSLSFALLIHLFFSCLQFHCHMFSFSLTFYFMHPNIIFHHHVPSHCCGFAVCLLEWAQWVCSHGLACRFGLGCVLKSFQAHLIYMLRSPLSTLALLTFVSLLWEALNATGKLIIRKLA